MVSVGTEEIVNGKGLGNLRDTAKELVSLAKEHKVWLFKGEMGSGKTTIIKEICNELGVVDNVTSPTFSIINEYHTSSEQLYHFDLYRVETLEEAIQAGVEEYLYSGSFCFIEWPEVITTILPETYLSINIVVMEGEERVYKISYHDTN